jgi:hypothetical protein
VKPALAPAFGPVFDLGGEHLGQEGEVTEPIPGGDLDQSERLGAHGGQAQFPGGGPDGGLAAVVDIMDGPS